MGRVLLVDDDPDVRLLLQHVLYDAGYQVDATESASEATALLASRRYDLVVADVILGDGTGLAVADRAKEAGTPTLIITGYGVAVASRLGEYDYLLKPIRPAELVNAVERALSPG